MCYALHYGIIDTGLLRPYINVLLSLGIETGYNIESGY